MLYDIGQYKGKWIIVTFSDGCLAAWGGSFWVDSELFGTEPMTFDSEAAAREYARGVWGEAAKEKL